MVAVEERPMTKARRPLSKKGSAILTLAILALIVLVFLLHKVDWTDPPIYPGATVLTSYTDFGKNIKQTVLISSDSVDKISLNYSDLLGENHWYSEIFNKTNRNYVLEDESKNIVLFDYDFFHTSCPAFYLNVTYEELADNKTLITLSQFAGPCGNRLK